MLWKKAPTGETYNVAEGKAYTQKEFREIASSAVARRHVVGIALPLWAVRTVSFVAEKNRRGKRETSTLNSDKFNIMKQRNWAVDISKGPQGFWIQSGGGASRGCRQGRRLV